MAESTLNDLVNSYRQSGKGRELILERVAALVYDSHGRFGFDNEDDAADALMKYRERIGKLLDRFEDRGISFDAYLASSLRFLAKTVRREKRQRYDRELVCESVVSRPFGESEAYADGGEALLLQESADARPEVFGKCVSVDRARSRRRPRARGGTPSSPALKTAYSSRLVFLAIKCAWEIDEEGVARVARSAGVDPEWLAAAIEQARRSLESERSRVERLAERRNASWCRQRLLEAKLASENDAYRHPRLEAALARERARYARIKEEFEALKVIVPNSVVARILGVPKGTVDSGLYYLRKRYGPAQGLL
jgi:hypothetical protein